MMSDMPETPQQVRAERDKLRQQLKDAEAEWIPVTERMPERDHKVEVYHPDEELYLARRAWNGIREVWAFSHTDAGISGGDGITHWREHKPPRTTAPVVEGD